MSKYAVRYTEYNEEDRWRRLGDRIEHLHEDKASAEAEVASLGPLDSWGHGENVHSVTLTERLPEVTPHVASVIEPGAILCSSWGYEQTNVDFYVVVRTTKSSAWIVKLNNVNVDGDPSWAEHVVAGDRYDRYAKPSQHRIQRSEYSGNVHEGLKIESYAWAHLWNGGELYASHYA